MEERTELREELLRDLEALYQLPAFSDLAALLQGEARVLQYLALRRGEDVYPSELAEALRLSRPRITASLSSLRRWCWPPPMWPTSFWPTTASRTTRPSQ